MVIGSDLVNERIAASLSTTRFGRVLEVHDALTSTNDRARQLADAGAEEGTVVIAREQLAGRGRAGRSWASPRGGLWMSVIFRPLLPIERWPVLGLLLAVASCSAIDEVTDLTTQVKWPNDLTNQGRKLAGVLVEATPAHAIGGIGINANLPPASLASFGEITTSLQIATGRPVDLNSLAAAVLSEIEQHYSRLPDQTWLLDEWRRRSETLGRAVHVIGAATFDGIAEGLDETGALLVRTAEGQRIVHAADVSIRLSDRPEA